MRPGAVTVHCAQHVARVTHQDRIRLMDLNRSELYKPSKLKCLCKSYPAVFPGGSPDARLLGHVAMGAEL